MPIQKFQDASDLRIGVYKLIYEEGETFLGQMPTLHSLQGFAENSLNLFESSV